MLQLVHTDYELQAEQFKGQTKQEPFYNKFIPFAHISHAWLEELEHFRQLFYA